MSKNLDVEIVEENSQGGTMRSRRTVTASVMIGDCDFEVKVGCHMRGMWKSAEGSVFDIGDWVSPTHNIANLSRALSSLVPAFPPVELAGCFHSSLRDLVPFLLGLPRTYARGYCVPPRRGWGGYACCLIGTTGSRALPGSSLPYFSAGTPPYFWSHSNSSLTLILPCQGFLPRPWPSPGKISNLFGMPRE